MHSTNRPSHLLTADLATGAPQTFSRVSVTRIFVSLVYNCILRNLNHYDVGLSTGCALAFASACRHDGATKGHNDIAVSRGMELNLRFIQRRATAPSGT